MRITSRQRTTVGAALLCGLLAACGGGTSGTTAGPKGAPAAAITVATNQQLTSLDGILQNSVPINNTIYDPLVHINGDGTIAPGLATAWTSDATGTSWTFTLREGATFSDGTPFTGNDVVWTYEKVKAEKTSRNNSYLTNLAGLTTTGNQVVFTLSKPFAAWPRQTSLIPIISAAAYQKPGADFAAKPVGTGPYRVTSFTPGQSLVLEANPTYWGPPPAIKKVTQQQIDTETTRLTGLQSGSVDVTTLSPATVETARSSSQLTVQSVPSNLVTYVGFNPATPSTSSVALRQAVSAAIDREAIAKTLLRGAATPIGQLLAPSVFGSDPSVKAPVFDRAKARTLVSQSGYDGSPIPFSYPNGPAVPQADQVAQAIQGYLKEVGITVTLQGQPQATFLQDWFAKRLTGMWLFSIQPSTLDADLVFNLTCVATNTFTDPTIAEAYVAQAAQPDEAQRRATLRRITDRINDQVYFTPLINAENEYVSGQKVTVPARADGHLLPQEMS
ncbi:MAG TPA: ABC transporter substrate-binding protein [Mycobacteriales bacterium]|nr:ABC transporter substrate-binding protein [Mycobacteriales bacterium]